MGKRVSKPASVEDEDERRYKAVIRLSPSVTVWIHLPPFARPRPAHPNPPPHKSQSAASHLSLPHRTTDPETKAGRKRGEGLSSTLAMAGFRLVGKGMLSGPSPRSTPFPQSTWRSSEAPLLMGFLQHSQTKMDRGLTL